MVSAGRVDGIDSNCVVLVSITYSAVSSISSVVAWVCYGGAVGFVVLTAAAVLFVSDFYLTSGLVLPGAEAIFLFRAFEPTFSGEAVSGVIGSSSAVFYTGISDAGLSAVPMRPFGIPSALIFSPRPLRIGGDDLITLVELDFLPGCSSTGGNCETDADGFCFIMLCGGCCISGAFSSSGGGDATFSWTVTRLTLLLLPLSLDFDLTDVFYFFKASVESFRSVDFSLTFFADESLSFLPGDSSLPFFVFFLFKLGDFLSSSPSYDWISAFV